MKSGKFLYFSSCVVKREIYFKPQIHSLAREIFSHKLDSLTDDCGEGNLEHRSCRTQSVINNYSFITSNLTPTPPLIREGRRGGEMLKCAETETEEIWKRYMRRRKGWGGNYITDSNPELDRSSTVRGDDTSETTAYFGSDVTQ